MSWRDRDYDSVFDNPGTTRGVAGYWPRGVTLVLLIVHTVAFVLVAAGMRDPDWEPVLAILDARSHPAGILLHPLFTLGVPGIMMALITTWSLGGQLERAVGWRPVLANYIVGNVAAGVGFYLLALVAPGLVVLGPVYPVGGEAAWVGMAWRLWRNTPVSVLGWTTTVARVCVICGSVMMLVTIVPARLGGTGWVVGIAAGVGVARWLQNVRLPRLRRAAPRWRPPRRAARLEVDDVSSDETGVDEILAKITRSGMGSLTAAERKQLEAARQAKLRRPSG